MAKPKKVLSRKAKIIGGSALAGGIVGTIIDVAAVATAPLTGGLSLGVVALTKAAEIGIGVAAGAAVGGTAGVVATKVADNKKAENAYQKGCSDTSQEYEAKFVEQAREFARKEAQWAKASSEWTATKEEKDRLLKKCLEYIAELEKEAASLRAVNRKLSKEKQELLDQLRAIKRGLSEAQEGSEPDTEGKTIC